MQAHKNPRVGKAAVRIVGLNLIDGVGFVRIGDGDETRVRWRHHPGSRLRWTCDTHQPTQDCTHIRAVVWHITAHAMNRSLADE